MRKLKLRSTQREAAQASHISWTYDTSSLSDRSSTENLLPTPCVWGQQSHIEQPCRPCLVTFWQ